MTEYTEAEQEEIARRLNAYPLLKLERDQLLEAIVKLVDASNREEEALAYKQARALRAKVEKSGPVARSEASVRS